MRRAIEDAINNAKRIKEEFHHYIQPANEDFDMVTMLDHIEAQQKRIDELENALKFYAIKSEWSGSPWKLKFNSSLQDSDGYVVAATALNI